MPNKEDLKLFISFCGADRKIKDDIKNRMEELIQFYKEKNVTLEIVEMDTHCTGDWATWMIQAIDSSDCFIAILTDTVFHAEIDKRVYEEVVEARNKGITRIPFIITDDFDLQDKFKSHLLGTSEVRLGNHYSELEYTEKLNELFLKTKNSLEKVYHGFVSEPELLPSYMEFTPSDIFIGREQEMEDIKKMFENSNVVILRGQGGIGKTCLAKNFFFKYRDLYSKAYIVSAPNGIKEAIANLDLLNVYQDSKDIEEKYKNNLNQLCKLSEKTIIILDNVDCGVNKTEINNLIHMHCRFIITSRPEYDSHNIVKEIGPLTDEDLVQLIYAKYPTIEKDNNQSKEEFQKGLLNLIEYAGRHTLTIEMAASIMKTGDISLDEICDKLLTITDKCRTEHTDEKLTIFERLSTLYNLVDLTEEHKKILCAMTLISPLIGIHRKELKEILKLEDNEAINELVDNTFLNFDPNTKIIKMHSLFSDVIFKKEKVEEDEYLINEDIIDWLDEQEIDGIKFSKILNMLEYYKFIYFKRKAIFTYNPDFDKESYKCFILKFAYFLESANYYDEGISVLKETISYMETSNLNLDSENFALLNNNLGKLYFTIADYKNAEKYFLKAQSIYEAVYEDDLIQPNLSMLYNNLGMLYQDIVDYEKAEEYLLKAKKINEELFIDDSDLALVYNNLGVLYQTKGDYEKSEENFLEAKEIYEAAFQDNPIHPDLARNYNNLGSVYQLKGDYEKAEEYFLEAEKIYKIIYEDNLIQPDIAMVYHNLGMVFQIFGDYAKAEEYLLKAQSIYEKAYEDNPLHPNVALLYTSLGTLYQTKEDYKKAVECYLKAQKIYEKVYEDNPIHPNIALVYNTLGSLYLSIGDYAKAEEYLLKTQKINEVVFKDNSSHLNVALIYFSLGELYQTKDDYEKAEENLLKAQKILEKVFEDNSAHPVLATVYRNLGKLYAKTKYYEKAEDYYLKSIAIYKKLYYDNPTHSDLVEAFYNLGVLYETTKDYKKSEENLLKSHFLSDRNPKHPYKKDIENSLLNLKKLCINNIVFNVQDIEEHIKRMIKEAVKDICYPLIQNNNEIVNDAIASAFNGSILPPNAIAVNVLKTLNDVEIVDYICEIAFSYIENNKKDAAEAKEKYGLDIPDNLVDLYMKDILVRIFVQSGLGKNKIELLLDPNIAISDAFKGNEKEQLLELYKQVLKYITHTKLQFKLKTQ